MKPIFLLTITILMLTACAETVNFDREAAEAVLEKQKEAWNQGNIDGYMEGYHKDDSIKFVGKNGVTYGWENVRSKYHKAYPDKEAMGRLGFDLLHIEPIGKAAIQVIGKWTLHRSSDTLIGHYLLIMKQFDNQWKIVVDATS